MRHAVFLGLGSAFLLCWAATAEAMIAVPAMPGPASADVTHVEYFCSPGFEPGRGGTCVAVPSRAEIELFFDQPVFDRPVYRRKWRRRHRGLKERY